MPGPLPPKARRARATPEALSRDTLAAITTRHSRRVEDRRSRAADVEAIMRERSVRFDELLGEPSRDELKATCLAPGLDTSGRERGLITERAALTPKLPTLPSDPPPGPQTPQTKLSRKPYAIPSNAHGWPLAEVRAFDSVHDDWVTTRVARLGHAVEAALRGTPLMNLGIDLAQQRLVHMKLDSETLRTLGERSSSRLKTTEGGWRAHVIGADPHFQRFEVLQLKGHGFHPHRDQAHKKADGFDAAGPAMLTVLHIRSVACQVRGV